jgi:hypothetical protein
LQKLGPRQLNDRLTEDSKIEPKKRWQKIVSLVGMIGVFVFTSYSLFEAYWTEDVLNCGKTGGQLALLSRLTGHVFLWSLSQRFAFFVFRLRSH